MEIMKKDIAVRKKEIRTAVLKQLKSLIGPMIICLIILAGVLVIAFWKEEPEPVEIVKVNAYDGDTQDIVLENEKLKLVMDPETTQFTMEVKETGKIWYSNPPDAGEDSLALNIEKEKLLSTLLLTYSTINGVDTLYNNYAYSMKNGIYDIEQGEDYIKIFYSIGDMDKEYIIPPVITAARMEELTEKMSKSSALMMQEYYKKYDINNLGKKDNREELLAGYPILETEVIYVLRSTAKDNVKSKLEGFFEEAGYTLEEYAADKALDMTVKSSEKPVFNVNVIYRLEGGDLVVEVPMDEIEYKEDYPLLYLNILPYFGAAGTREKGFMLVPEGGGALINFNNGKIAQNSYYANIYGWDMAQDRKSVVHETRTYFNVFGMSGQDNSFICIMEKGAPYAAIQADISGRNNSYNFVNAVYNIVHREQYDVADKYNGAMFVYEEAIPREDIVNRYRFVNSGSYVEMANAYNSYLLDKYGDSLTLNEDAQTPVALEILGAVDKVKQVFGVTASKPLKLTTYSEAKQMLSELYGQGMTNVSVKLSGWMNGGVQQKILKKVKPVTELGSRKELQSLIGFVNDSGMDIYLDGVTDYAFDSSLFDGFFAPSDVARLVSKEKAELSDYSLVTYGKADEENVYYLLKGETILQMARKLTEESGKLNAGVSFQNMGMELSSDFNRDEPVSRQAALEAQEKLLQEISASGQGIMMNMGNDYAIAYADMVTNMDLGGSKYTILDRTVPFYQLALHGYVNYTGEPLNLTQNREEELLKSAEYGAGLSFTLMKETAFVLQKTLYTKYFGADYDAWHDRMLDIYTRYNAELGHTFSQRMTEHAYISEKVTCTAYEDGTKVYVNYSYEDYRTEDGNIIPARDYKTVR